MEMQRLTVQCYAELPEEERRVTLSPTLITVIIAHNEDITLNNRPLRPVQVVFMDGNSVDLILDHADLNKLEEAIGSYCFE